METEISEPHLGYLNLVRYGFAVIHFIPVDNWDKYENARILWIWGNQNSFLPHCHAYKQFYIWR
jgi:hypothetical protein